MTDYFTMCDKSNAASLTGVLTSGTFGHAIVGTITNNIILQNFDGNAVQYLKGLPGTDPELIIHSRK